MSDSWIAIQVIMMPKDANPLAMLHKESGYPLYNTIFGGVILSYIDMAGAMSARRAVLLRGGSDELAFVTVALNRVEFKEPVLVGDVVRFETSVAKIGRTSITIHINVFAERGREVLRVTEAEVVYVGVRIENGERKPSQLLP
jgi:acyl-CoA thioesterase YciA